MKKHILTAFCWLALSATAFASENLLLPNLQFFTTSRGGDAGAVSFLGEVGGRNFRANGTYGVYFTPCQRFKTSAEFLTQRLDYHFDTDRRKNWVGQCAVGAEYEVLIHQWIIESFDVSAAYSHAFNHTIDSDRRIGGSDGGYGYAGLTWRFWPGAYLSGGVNYDYVKFHRHFSTPHVANGFGGSFNFLQQLPCNVTFNFEGEFRRPFNFVQAMLNWQRYLGDDLLVVGIYGNYTGGKRGLPDATCAGIQIGFAFGGPERCGCECVCASALSNWVSNPAVYMPIVLAVADPRPNQPCTPPTVTATIPTQVFNEGDTFTINTNVAFSSNLPLTFSATGLPTGVTINSSTGEISGDGTTPSGSSTITVTATSSCGQASTTFTLQINGGGE